MIPVNEYIFETCKGNSFSSTHLQVAFEEIHRISMILWTICTYHVAHGHQGMFLMNIERVNMGRASKLVVNFTKSGNHDSSFTKASMVALEKGWVTWIPFHLTPC
jgi:hypothetical protein